MTTDTQAKKFLGEYGVVTRLVQEFASDVMAIFDEKIVAGPGGPEAEQSIVDRAAKLAAVFKGEDPGYEVAEWRSNGRLEGKLVAWFGIPGNGDVILEFFKLVALQVLKNCRAVHEGMAEEEAGPRLKSYLDDVVQKLVGVQP